MDRDILDKPALPGRDARDTPPAYPYGWFAVAFSRELTPGGLLTRRFMNRDIVVYRTRSGTARAIEAHCPHLGAHFGHGGSVQNEELRCPFHGFRFSVEGRCTFSPYGTPPPAARLGMLELREVCGVLMVWHGPPDQQLWEIEPPTAELGWRTMRTKKLRFHSHPQEITENSVDSGHFGVLHGFGGVRTIEPMVVDGPRLRTRYSFTRPLPLMGGISTEIDVRVDGLGFSIVELEAAGWAIRQLVLSTPIGEREVAVHVGTAVRSRGRTALSRAAWRPMDAVLERIVLRGVVTELRRDQEIWDHKMYLDRPAIAAGDGPIGKYRAWTRQFYPRKES